VSVWSNQNLVIPAKAGIQKPTLRRNAPLFLDLPAGENALNFRLCGNDGVKYGLTWGHWAQAETRFRSSNFRIPGIGEMVRRK
jgi:hypothetical protein